MVESRYLERFKQLEGSKYVLRGDRLLVELLPPLEIQTSSGLILSSGDAQIGTAEQNRPDIGVVLDVGEGYYNESTGEPMKGDVKQGYVVMLPSLSTVIYRSTWPGLGEYTSNGLVVVSEGSISMYWESVKAYADYCDKLRSK